MNSWAVSIAGDVQSGPERRPRRCRSLRLPRRRPTRRRLHRQPERIRSGGLGAVPFLPIGSLRKSTSAATRVRLTKYIPIKERFKAMFTFDAFNVFNHRYFTAVNTRMYVASGNVYVSEQRRAGNFDVGLPGWNQCPPVADRSSSRFLDQARWVVAGPDICVRPFFYALRVMRLPVRTDSRAASRISVTITLFSSELRPEGFSLPRTTAVRYEMESRWSAGSGPGVLFSSSPWAGAPADCCRRSRSRSPSRRTLRNPCG